MKVRVCFRANGLGVDDEGNPAPAGVCVNLGESDTPIDYEKLTGAINKEALLAMVSLTGLVQPEGVEFITPEEYDREYGD